jgi:hypothetical protein
MVKECLIANEEINVVGSSRIAMRPDGKTTSEGMGNASLTEFTRGDRGCGENLRSHDTPELSQIRGGTCR